MKKKLIYFFIFFPYIWSNSIADIPIIVISPSKKAQSISTIGTSVTVLDEKFFTETEEVFLGDVLSNNSTSINFFQTGGYGSTSAVQLRGLPKRYSTVYIDGVKMSDPSSVSNDFDFNNILTSQISRVEILKGNQSSVYGSGAIGGTINITTRKPEKGFKNKLNYSSGSNNTHNLSSSISNSDDDKDYLLTLERFQTDGISAMSHNDENDGYKSNNLLIKYNYRFQSDLELKSNLRLADTYLQYDKELNTATATHSEEQDTTELSSNITLNYKTFNNLENNFTIANTIIKRNYGAAAGSGNTSKDKYLGDRLSFIYNGNYNFNLDNSITFGIEKEEDKIGFNKDLKGNESRINDIISKYFDYQTRVAENLYLTLGSRFDEHSIAGNEDSHRITSAYIFNDKKTKLKSSLGTGFRFPSLYEMYFVYAANADSLNYVKAEKSRSFDLGIEKNFLDNKIKLDVNYFNLEYSDVLEGWKTGNSSGLNYTTQNMHGTVKSQGIEFFSNFKKSENLNLNFNYTYTSTYDGAEQDDPDKSSSYSNVQMVRVPRHFLGFSLDYKIPYKKLRFKINTKWSDEMRDYGNGNRTYNDERLDDFILTNLKLSCDYTKKYKLFLNINNIFDENYETAKDYSQLGRNFYFGIKQNY